MDFVFHVQNLGIVAAAGTAVLTALGLLARRLHQMGKWLHNVHDVTNNISEVVGRELNRNGGSSMKDQLTAVRTEQERLRDTLQEHVSDVQAHAADPTAHVRPTTPDQGGAGPR